MESIEVTSSEELAEILTIFGDEYLFRGQVKNYTDGTSSPSLLPSFFANGGRDGCIPNVRQRWSTYANFIIYTILGHNNFDQHLNEAILQHYGWKSFFLDLSASAHVASWFASHTYEQNIRIHVAEDCWEEPVYLRNLEASYKTNSDNGNLYVISKKDLMAKGYKLLDLSILETESGNSRPCRQQALLTGPFDGQALPVECISYHIIGPSSIFREHAGSAGYADIESIFPPVAEDPIYSNLLRTPWHRMNAASERENTIDFYERFLEIPDYYPVFRKHLPPSVVFYDGLSIHDLYLEQGDSLNNPVFIQIDDIVYFSPVVPAIVKFKELKKLLDQWDTIVFELDLIVPRPDMEDSESYTKALVLEKQGNGTLKVFEMTVTYAGKMSQDVGSESGWHYEINGKGKIERLVTDDDCPCRNNRRHEFHVEVLKRIESGLKEGRLCQQISERLFKFG